MAAPAEAPSAPPWPGGLAGTPAVGVIERAMAQGRLGHSLLLHGDSLETLTAVALTLAARLLDPEGRFPAGGHPDCFSLRPSGKSRQIGADATRALIAQVQVSAAVAGRKVGIVFEADRMNATAANIFLKTLEEPPANTTLLLLSVHPYALIPTIRSRCLHFRFPADPRVETQAQAAGWPEWIQAYRAWLARLEPGGGSPPPVAEAVFGVYGLVARFDAILEQATAAAWDRRKETLPEELGEEERVALETGLANGLRARFFAEIEEATRAHTRARLGPRDGGALRRAFAAAVAELERGASLLRLNLNESAALENFLLASLRLWSR